MPACIYNNSMWKVQFATKNLKLLIFDWIFILQYDKACKNQLRTTKEIKLLCYAGNISMTSQGVM